MEVEKQVAEFKKVIESCHLNFLFGSGASRPFLDTLNNLETNFTFINESSAPSIVQNIDLLKASIFIEYLNKCLFGNLFFNVDEITGYQKACIDNKNGKADEFVIVRETYNTFINNINTLLSSRDMQLLSKQVNIFTTNVDVFLEESLETNDCSFNDGFSGRKSLIFDTSNFHNTIHKLSTHYEYKSEVPHVNLFKIHGSLNWVKGSKRSDTEYNIFADYPLELLASLYEVYSKNPKDFIEYNVISDGIKDLNYKFLDNVTKTKIIDAFLELYSKIVMVNPTKQKFEDTTRNVHYYEMLRLYANHLERENSVLYVLGFSFADEHILKITQRVAKSNPTLLIYILCANHQQESFNEKFRAYPNVKFLFPEDGYFTLEILNEYFKKVIDSIPSNT